MKKFLFLMIVLSALSVSAQSIRLFHNGQIVNNLDTIEENVNSAKSEIITYVNYANIGNDDVYARVSKQILQLANGAHNTFCVANGCYDGLISQEFYVAQGDTITDTLGMFHSAYTYAGSGTSLIKYKFYNTSNASDTISFLIRYSVLTGIASNKLADNSLRAYPNPATTSVNIEYNAPESHSNLVIKNLTGSTVYKQAVSLGTGKVNVNVSDLPNGIYFYGIESNGKMLNTKKLLIK